MYNPFKKVIVENKTLSRTLEKIQGAEGYTEAQLQEEVNNNILTIIRRLGSHVGLNLPNTQDINSQDKYDNYNVNFLAGTLTFFVPIHEQHSDICVRYVAQFFEDVQASTSIPFELIEGQLSGNCSLQIDHPDKAFIQFKKKPQGTIRITDIHSFVINVLHEEHTCIPFLINYPLYPHVVSAHHAYEAEAKRIIETLRIALKSSSALCQFALYESESFIVLNALITTLMSYEDMRLDQMSIQITPFSYQYLCFITLPRRQFTRNKLKDLLKDSRLSYIVALFAGIYERMNTAQRYPPNPTQQQTPPLSITRQTHASSRAKSAITKYLLHQDVVDEQLAHQANVNRIIYLLLILLNKNKKTCELALPSNTYDAQRFSISLNALVKTLASYQGMTILMDHDEMNPDSMSISLTHGTNPHYSVKLPDPSSQARTQLKDLLINYQLPPTVALFAEISERMRMTQRPQLAPVQQVVPPQMPSTSFFFPPPAPPSNATSGPSPYTSFVAGSRPGPT